MQKALLIGVLGLFTLPLLAETQTGYVRTIGRNGKPGKPISGVMVRAEGPANMVMSDTNGQFALLLNDLGRDDAFKLTTVKKSNYELLDKDLIGRECGFTPVPMEIVLVNLSEMQAEKAAMAERFEQKYAETYQKKVAELQAQLDAQQITIDEAQQRQEELDQALEKMLSQIETLVDRYVRTDYDRLDSLDQVINAHIEQGEFDEAERLIRSKGSVEERLAALQERQEVQRQLEEAARQVAKANDKDIQSLKRDLNLLIDIAEAHLRPDSAYYYRQQLAEVDPEDVEVMTKLIDDSYEFGDFDRMFFYFDKADSLYQTKKDPDIWKWSLLREGMGYLLRFYLTTNYRVNNGDTITWFDYYVQAEDMICTNYGEINLDCAEKVAYLATLRDMERDTSMAKMYYEQAFHIFRELVAQDSTDLWLQYHLCEQMSYAPPYVARKETEETDYCLNYLLEQALRDSVKNDSLIEEILWREVWLAPNYFLYKDVLPKYREFTYRHLKNLDDTCRLAHFMTNILYYDNGNISPSLSREECEFAIDLLENHDCQEERVLCRLYRIKGDYTRAEECYEQELQHTISIYGLKNHNTADLYKEIADFYKEIGDKEKSLKYYSQVIESGILEMESYFYVMKSYENIGLIYKEKGKYDYALENFKKALEIATWGGWPQVSAKVQFEMGYTYKELNNKKQAKEWYQKALKGYQELEDEEGIAKVKAALAELKKK